MQGAIREDPAADPRGERRRRVGGAILVTAVAALLILPAVGRQVITTSDEARFVLIARDMLARDVWFEAVVREKQYRNKPPLYPWSIAAVSRLTGGVTEFAAGLPIALAAVATVVLTFLLGDGLFGWRAGLAAALLLATSYGFFQHSFELLPDMLVVAFSTLAGYAFWRAQRERDRRGWIVLFYAALALGVFSKGPMGLLPLAPVILWLWLTEGAAGLRRLLSPLGAGVFIAVTLVWVWPFLKLGTGSFGQNVLLTDWLEWYFGVPSAARLGNVVLDLLLGFAPWTLLAPFAFAGAWRNRTSPPVRFALLWCLVSFILIALAENQRRRYLLPVYPGAALTVAWWLFADLAARTRAARAAGWVAAAGALAAIMVLGWLGRSPDWFVAAVSWAAAPFYLALAVLGLSSFVGLRAGRPALVVGGGVLAMLVLLGWGVQPYTRWVNATQDFRGLATRVEQHARGGEVGVYGGRFFQLDVYLGRPLIRLRDTDQLNAYLARPGAPIVVVDDRAWRFLQGQLPSSIRVLETMRVRAWDMRLLRLDGR